MTRRLLQCVVLAIVAAAAMAAAAAEITFFERDSFRGRSYTAVEAIADFGATDFNDRASSVVIRSGSWQLCTDAFLRGRCVTLNPGEYPSLAAMGMENVISSARPFEAGRISLYEFPGFGGRSVALEGDTRNFDPLGINDRASSAIVHDGTWELCEHADYGGQCIVLAPGRHPDLGWMANRASSARLVTGGRPGGGGGGGAGGGGGPGWGGGGGGGGGQGPGGRARAILYERAGFSGRSFELNNEVVSNLDRFGFNDRASSLRVEAGFWIFCTAADFLGECRTFGPGEYPQLPWDLNNRISSGRRISVHYPYSGNPNWSPR